MARETERIRLTLDRIRKMPTPAGTQAVYVFDDDPRQLCVRVTPAGAKSFVFAGKFNKVPLRVTIGDVKVWSLDDARAEARRLQALIDLGTDPRQEKADKLAAAAAKREEERRVEALALEAWSAYTEARKARWSEPHIRDHEVVSKEGGAPRTRGRRNGESNVTLPGALRPLLLLPLARIDADRVRVWLEEEADRRPTHARLAFGLLRAFLNWCADRPEYRDQTHADACTPRAARESLPKKAAKDDCLQREQLATWFEQVRQIPNLVISAYLQCLLLTGPRREELSGLRWADVDFQWKSLTIKDKVEGQRVIPLTPFVASLLAGLPRRNEWVFSSSTAESGRLQEPRIAHNKALAAAGLPALSLHGLRRSFGTLSEWVECPVGVVAQIQGHKPSATAEKHYRRRPLDLLRMWHVKIEGWILEQAGIEQPGEEQAPGLRLAR